MKLYFEWGTRQLMKRGEELCGDSISVARRADSITMTLSDGLGSGVKANILATLTTQIAMNLLTNDLPLDEVVETLTETLPVDRVRKLAYSTFAIAQFFRDGAVRIAIFDSPMAVVLRKREVLPVAYDERMIAGKDIQEALVELEIGDWIIFVSDGVLNAGIGGVYPLGWGWDQAARFMHTHSHPDMSADDLAEKIAEAVSGLYAGEPGDDVSIIVVKVRKKLAATVLTGPPRDRSMDREVVERFMKMGGKHVVCGGTTAKIVSQHIGRPLVVDLNTMTKEVPPVGRMEGIDLASEGILTLTRTNTLLQTGVEKQSVRYQVDGAATLLRILLTVDHITFLVGEAVNPAHQNPDLPHQLGIRLNVVEEIAQHLHERGKEVSIETV